MDHPQNHSTQTTASTPLASIPECLPNNTWGISLLPNILEVPSCHQSFNLSQWVLLFRTSCFVLFFCFCFFFFGLITLVNRVEYPISDLATWLFNWLLPFKISSTIFKNFLSYIGVEPISSQLVMLCYIHCTIFKMDNQQGLTVAHRILLMLHGSLDGKGLWSNRCM